MQRLMPTRRIMEPFCEVGIPNPRSGVCSSDRRCGVRGGLSSHARPDGPARQLEAFAVCPPMPPADKILSPRSLPRRVRLYLPPRDITTSSGVVHQSHRLFAECTCLSDLRERRPRRAGA